MCPHWTLQNKSSHFINENQFYGQVWYSLAIARAETATGEQGIVRLVLWIAAYPRTHLFQLCALSYNYSTTRKESFADSTARHHATSQRQLGGKQSGCPLQKRLGEQEECACRQVSQWLWDCSQKKRAESLEVEFQRLLSGRSGSGSIPEPGARIRTTSTIKGLLVCAS